MSLETLLFKQSYTTYYHIIETIFLLFTGL